MGPADLLEGQTLAGKWKVTKRIVPKPTDTGGHFSTGYLAEDSTGRKAFIKAMDYTRAFSSPDHVLALNALTSAYLFEKNICERCKTRHLDRVVHAIESFTVQADPKSPLSKVECLVFERADGDIRGHLNAAKDFDVAFVLRALHHVATAMEQLHRADIAHQDLKPSNVLVFGKDIGSKVGDFGRAWARGMSVAHDNYPVAGDRGYAPPELLYGFIPPEVNVRRFGCDMYLLGSLAAFLFTAVQMNGLIIKHLDHSHRPYVWGGTYDGVLPYVQAAFGSSLIEFGYAIPTESKRELVEMVSYLCQPDPGKRGHPLNRQGHTNQFGLDRFISGFDLLASKAEIRLAGEKR